LVALRAPAPFWGALPVFAGAPALAGTLPDLDPGEAFPEEGLPDEDFPYEGLPVEAFPEEGFPEEGFPEEVFPAGALLPDLLRFDFAITPPDRRLRGILAHFGPKARPRKTL